MATETMEKPKADPKPKAEAQKEEYALKGKGENATADVNTLVRHSRLQVRDGGTKEARAQTLADAIKGGADLPRVKVIEVPEYPGHPAKDGPYRMVFDGFHTTRGYELLDKKMIPVTIWKGTWVEALVAASKANREHDTSGLPRSNEGKVNAAKAFVLALQESDTPKSQWPSNRRIAEIVGASRDTVNKVVSGTHESSKAAKRKPAENAVDPPLTGAQMRQMTEDSAKIRADEKKRIDAGETPYNVVGRMTGQTIGRVFGVTTPTHEDVKAAHPTLQKGDYILKVADLTLAAHGKGPGAVSPTTMAGRPAEGVKPDEKPTAKNFDWASYDSQIGYLVRGLDAMGDIFDLKKTVEHKAAERVLNEFVTYFADVRKKHGPKKAGK